MYAFQFHRPSSLDDAERIFGESDDPRYVAGGHTILPSMKLRLAAPSDIIDIGDIEALKGLRVESDDVIVGAGVRHADVARSNDVSSAIPALADLAAMIGDFQVRNRGTLGGSIANADPAADYPAALVGLGATNTATAHRKNRTSIAAQDIDEFHEVLELVPEILLDQIDYLKGFEPSEIA